MSAIALKDAAPVEAGSVTVPPDAGGVTVPATPAVDAAISGAAPCVGGARDIVVSGVDRAGYPPYAISGCALLYVARDGSLRLRDLTSGAEEQIAAAADAPSRPSLAGPAAEPARVVTWESGAMQAVRVRFAGESTLVRGAYHHTGQPRAASDTVVLSGWVDSDPGGDSDVLLYAPESKALTVVGGGPGQQLFADVSDSHVVYSDFSEDSDGRFDDNGADLADLVLVDRKTGARLVHPRGGKQAFPLLTRRGSIVYLDWASSHPEPKLSAYAIAVWRASGGADDLQLATVQTLPPYVRPSVWGDSVEWVERPASGDERLMRVALQGGQPAQVVFSMPGTQLFATASSAEGTLMAATTSTEPDPRLRSVAR
jgi:hypothetical protein